MTKMLNNILLSATIVASVLLTASLAKAQPCQPLTLCVVDAKGKQIGNYTQDSFATRNYGGFYYNILVGQTGLQETSFFLYASTDCSGTAYLPWSNTLPLDVYPDKNQALWTPSNNTVDNIDFQSYQYWSGCTTYPYGPIKAGVAVLIDAKIAKTWVPPFSVTILRASPAQPCPPTTLCVVDATGKQVGNYTSADWVARNFGGAYYNITVEQNQIISGAEFYYASVDCSGTPYILWDDKVLPTAGIDPNGVLWAPSDTVVNNISFQSSGDGQPGDFCFSRDWGATPATPAMVVDTTVAKTWVPPFSVVIARRVSQ